MKHVIASGLGLALLGSGSLAASVYDQREQDWRNGAIVY